MIGLLIILCGFTIPSAHYNNLWAVRVVQKEPRDQTLFNRGLSIGLSGAVTTKFTTINDHFNTILGGRFGVTFNHCLFMGVGLYGSINGIELDQTSPGLPDCVALGSAGLLLEVIPASRKLLHPAFNLLIGGGSIYYEDFYYRDDDGFFICEPGMNLMLNITQNLRLGIGGSYRYLSGVERYGLKNSDIKGFSGVIILKFGRF